MEHAFRGWVEIDLYLLLARWGEPPARLCRFPRAPSEIRRLVNGESSAALNSLLHTPHFLILGRWWTFYMPIKDKDNILPSHIYEYGFLILDYLVNLELSRECETCQSKLHCEYHSGGMNPTFIPPDSMSQSLPMVPFDEYEWYRRLENEVNLLKK